ncbi:MAG: hypothetical protein ABI134_19795 [Byssovorax sp.]
MAPGAPPIPEAAVPRDPGRSLAWRAGTTVAGLGFVAAGVAVILWPAIVAYAVGGAIALLGAFLVVSALAARGS